MGKYVLIFVLGSIIIFGIINLNVNVSLTRGVQNAVDNYSDTQSRNIGNSMVYMALSRLADSSSWRSNTFQTMSFFNGTAQYRVVDTIAAGDSVIKITVVSSFNGITKTINAYSKKDVSGSGWVPPFVRAAWTANGNLNRTISDMYIDGRDHLLDGTISPKTGVYGVSTSQTFVNTFNALIGGTKDSVDYPPSYPQNPNVIEQNYDWGGSFPTSPDAILGYPEGTLKSVAQSGKYGSQYVTNPNQLKSPLAGVTYFEPPDSKTYSLNLGKSKTQADKGLLIVHNSGCLSNAVPITMKNNMAFQGLIVGDYMFHFHLDVEGAILLLSPNLELTKTCQGNNGHHVNYSSQAIINAVSSAYLSTGLIGNKGSSSSGTSSSVSGGFGAGRKKVIYWDE